MDPTTSGLDQAGIMAILQRLGLGQFSGGSSGDTPNFGQLSAQTVDGQAASFDPGTVNLSGGRHFTDQQLMAGLSQPQSTGNNAGMPTSQMWSGGVTGNQQQQQEPYWWPKSNSELKSYYSEQNAFLKNQADSITKLLGGLGQQSSTAAPAPINLATQLSTAAPPNVAPVVNGPANGFLDPTKSIIPGMGNSAPAPGSLPSLTASPNAASLASTQNMVNQQNALPSLATKLQTGAIQPSDITGAGGPLMASTGSGIQPGSLPASPTIQPSYSSGPALRSYAPPTTPLTPKASAAQGGSIEANPAAYNNPGNVFVNQPGQPAVAYPDATATNTNAGAVVNNSATDTSTAIPDATASGAGMAGGSGPSPKQYGSVIASGIGALGKALMPVSISNSAATKIDASRLPRAPLATFPAMTGR
jgi:hypothetical protein